MRIRKIVCVIIALLTLCGCGSIDSSVLNYAERSFCADVEGQVDGLDFAARVQVSAPGEDNTHTAQKTQSVQKPQSAQKPQSVRSVRSVRVEFSSPESLRGIVVTKGAEGTSISLDGTVISDAAAQGWLIIAQLLIPEGQVVSIKKSEGETATATVALDSKQTIVIDLNTGAPLEASVDGARSAFVRVTRFEYVE